MTLRSIASVLCLASCLAIGCTLTEAPADQGGGGNGGGSGSGGGGGSGGGIGGFLPDEAPGLGKGTSYYISPSGDDSKDGTSPQTAWKTLARASKQEFGPGDNLLLEGGATFQGTLALGMDDGGTQDAPISVTSYGQGRATIDAGAKNGIDVYNTAGIQIWELNVRGGWDAAAQAGNEGVGIQFYMDLGGAKKLAGVAIDRVDVRGFMKGGISIGASPLDTTKSGFRAVRITNCSVHDNGDSGIGTWGYFDPKATAYAHEDVTVRGCAVFQNEGIAGKSANTGSGIVLGDVKGALVEHNVAYENGARNDFPGGGPVGIWAWDSDGVVIQFNESHHNRTKTADGDGFDLDGGVTRSVLQYNYSHDNDGAGLLVAQFPGARPMKDNIIRYNVSENDCRNDAHGAINFWNGNETQGIDGVVVHGNTVFLSPGKKPAAALNFMTDSKAVRVIDNALVTTGGLAVINVPDGQAELLLSGNDYWASGAALLLQVEGKSYADLATLRKGTGQERWGGADTGLTVDPRLVAPGQGGTLGEPGLLGKLSAYRLQDASPLVDAGIDPAALGIDPGPHDFFGTKLFQGKGPDVGAYERPAP
jgi:hypothetical protein